MDASAVAPSRALKNRDGLLLFASGVLGAVICWRIAMSPVSRTFQFTWMPTRLGTFILVGVAASAMVAAAVYVARTPPAGWSTMAIVLGLAAVPVLGYTDYSIGLPGAIVTTGVVILESAAYVAGRRAGGDAAWGPRLLLKLTLFLIVATQLLFLLGGLGTQRYTVTGTHSPDGAWTITRTEMNSMFGGSLVVTAHRSWAGLVQQKRIVYWGDVGDDPAIDWVDSRTLCVNGSNLRLYWDPAIDDEQWD